jgi:hypothetical protein
MHELAVINAVIVCSRIDPDNPQASEISFARPSVAIRIIERTCNGFIGYAKQLAAWAGEPFCKG